MAETNLPRGAGRGPLPSRREFVKAIGTTALAASLPAPWDGGRPAAGATDGKVSPSSADESSIARFYRALDDGGAGASASLTTTRSGRGSRATGRSSSRRSAT